MIEPEITSFEEVLVKYEMELEQTQSELIYDNERL